MKAKPADGPPTLHLLEARPGVAPAAQRDLVLAVEDGLAKAGLPYVDLHVELRERDQIPPLFGYQFIERHHRIPFTSKSPNAVRSAMHHARNRTPWIGAQNGS